MSTVEEVVPPQETQQRQPTLEEYAMGVDQNNRDLQRQSVAYAYLQNVNTAIDHHITHPDSERGGLPHIIVRIPTRGDVPEQFEFDLNVLPVAYLPRMKPVFEMMTAAAGNTLMQAWDGIINIAAHARPIIDQARNQQSNAGQQPPQGAVTGPPL